MKKTMKGFAVIVMLCLLLGLFYGCTETEKSKYEGAQSLLSQGKYAEAAERFEALGGYEESSKLTIYCKAAEAGERGDYETALNGFMTLGEYKDSPLMLNYYNTRMYEDGSWRDKLYAAGLYEQNKLFRDSAARAESCRKSVYNDAVALQQAGEYEEAITQFEAMNGYSDSVAQIEACRESIRQRDYQAAMVLQQDGKYEEAITAFEALNGYKDSKAQAEACRESIRQRDYQAAIALQQDGKYEEAITAFEALNGYKDSKAQAEACRESIRQRDYQAAMALQQDRKYEEAITVFEALNGYKDSKAQAEACRESIRQRDYQAAVALQQAGKYEEAITAFTALGSYSDAAAQIKETKYLQAKALTAAGYYAGAVSIFSGIKGYKDVDSLLANDHNLSAAAAAAARDAKYSVGNYVTFGHYPQTSGGNDSTEIEWLVLARDGSKALLLSRYGLDNKQYNEKSVNITWEECTLRTWLNGEFMNKAFTAREQAGIVLTSVDNTQDKIFLLSRGEASEYLDAVYFGSSTKSRVEPTAYTIKQGVFTSSSYKTADGTAAGWWWLRSPDYLNQRDAVIVDADGSFYHYHVTYGSGCVRPALWINLESDIF